MFTDLKLEELVTLQIEKEETLGVQKGSSDHIGHKSYTINEIGSSKQVDDGWEIPYIYTITVENEFTIYPDNPPHEYRYEKTIIVDDSGNVIRESEKKNLGSPFDNEIETWVSDSEKLFGEDDSD